MSVIGVIAVYKCDGCGAIKTLNTDLDLQAFSQWLSGKTKDFCPSCKFTSVSAKPQPQIDLATEKIVTGLMRRIKNSAGSPPYQGGVEAASADGVVLSPHSPLEKEAA